MKKILVMGLPGVGKTTLSVELARELCAVHFNADEVRQKINKDLGFDVTDRIEHAKRMGVLCDIVNRTGVYAIADFVCPTVSAREAFGTHNSFVIWVNRTPCRDFSDTTKLFTPPKEYHVRVTDEYDLSHWVNQCTNLIKSLENKDFEI